MKVVMILALMAVPSLAFGKAADVKKYKEAFPGKEVSCKTCHTKGKELNDYGKKVQAAGGDLVKVGPAN